MRESRFRGKRLDNREWLESKSIWQEEAGIMLAERDCGVSFWIAVDPATVGEWTGLKDKNGREIYEHQRIRCSWSNGLHSEGVIEWCDGAFLVRGDDGSTDWLHKLRNLIPECRPEITDTPGEEG